MLLLLLLYIYISYIHLFCSFFIYYSVYIYIVFFLYILYILYRSIDKSSLVGCCQTGSGLSPIHRGFRRISAPFGSLAPASGCRCRSSRWELSGNLYRRRTLRGETDNPSGGAPKKDRHCPWPMAAGSCLIT